MNTSEHMEYSVLMSVYYKEKPEFLQAAINSIWIQTVPTNDFVLVCDGPLGDSLEKVIVDMEAMHPELNVIRLPENKGLGNALNIGLKHCKNELVARMDSDDISFSDRCEKQLGVFRNNPDIGICSGTVAEFDSDIRNISQYRIVPELNEDIINFSKYRNPFNHPSVMYKKSCVEKVNSYEDFYLLEDYYLWIKMLNCGIKGYNIQEPILYMRAGNGLYNRRGGKKYLLSQISLFKYMYVNRYINLSQFLFNTSIRSASSLSPNWLRRLAFKMSLREKVK